MADTEWQQKLNAPSVVLRYFGFIIPQYTLLSIIYRSLQKSLKRIAIHRIIWRGKALSILFDNVLYVCSEIFARIKH